MHKHAKILIAIANGKEVEYSSKFNGDKSNWITMTKESCCTPLDCLDLQWRIKTNIIEDTFNKWMEHYSNSLVSNKFTIWEAAFEKGVESTKEIK